MSVHNQPLFVSAIRDYGRSLVNISAVFTDNETEQQDLYQKIVLAIWQALPHFQQQQDLCIFIYRVAFNCVFRQVTKVEPAGYNAINASESLLVVMRQLPLSQRQLLCLVFDGFSHDDIGVICGVELNLVPSLIETAQKQFEQRMMTIENSGEVTDV